MDQAVCWLTLWWEIHTKLGLIKTEWKWNREERAEMRKVQKGEERRQAGRGPDEAAKHSHWDISFTLQLSLSHFNQSLEVIPCPSLSNSACSVGFCTYSLHAFFISLNLSPSAPLVVSTAAMCIIQVLSIERGNEKHILFLALISVNYPSTHFILQRTLCTCSLLAC